LRITGPTTPIQNMLLAALPKVTEFTAAEAPVPMAAPAPTAPPQPVSVEMLVALAASESPVDRRRRQVASADGALATLERLNAELLAGVHTVERLKEVAAWTHDLDAPPDPALVSLYNDIELRLRVELAKHDIVA
jgi:Class II flagellar assembly regulator